MRIVFSVQPSLISTYKEQQLITAEILPRQERFQQTVRCLLDKVRLEHAAPAPVISPLKARPLTTPQSTSSRDVSSATSSWGGSRIGAGSLSKKDKQKLKRRMYNTKLAFRRKLCGIRIKRKQLKRIKQEHLRVKISSYVEKLQESNLDCDFSPVSEENTSTVSTYQITKLSNQSTTLLHSIDLTWKT